SWIRYCALDALTDIFQLLTHGRRGLVQFPARFFSGAFFLLAGGQREGKRNQNGRDKNFAKRHDESRKMEHGNSRPPGGWVRSYTCAPPPGDTAGFPVPP